MKENEKGINKKLLNYGHIPFWDMILYVFPRASKESSPDIKRIKYIPLIYGRFPGTIYFV